MTLHFASDEKIAETSSKGNQEKWQENGRWYKADQFGYEALAETAVSSLLENSSIEAETPFTFVRYRMEKIYIHGREKTACSSENFLRPGQSIITVSHLLKNTHTLPVRRQFERLGSDVKRIQYLAEEVKALTGLEHFPEYLTLLFEIDALFMNDDRHLNNIAVIEENGKYSYCPVFDNGAALLSNTQMLGMDISPAGLIPTVKARPFNTTFNRQAGSAEKLYGRQLQIRRPGADELKKLMDPMLEYYPARDRGYIRDRVETVLRTRFKWMG